MKFLKQAVYVRYVIGKLPKFVQLACRPPQDPFYGWFFEI